MPAKDTGVSDALRAAMTAAEVHEKLPKTIFVRRGHVRAVFGLSEEEMTALVTAGVFRAIHLPANKRGKRKIKKTRAVFLRTEVVAVSRNWEAGR